MAKETFSLTVSKVDAPLYAGQAQSVTVPGVSGEMQLLAHHEPLISPLAAGTVSIVTEEGQLIEETITHGTLEVSNGHVTVLI